MGVNVFGWLRNFSLCLYEERRNLCENFSASASFLPELWPFLGTADVSDFCDDVLVCPPVSQ